MQRRSPQIVLDDAVGADERDQVIPFHENYPSQMFILITEIQFFPKK